MSQTLAIELAGERLLLDAERALYWPAQGALLLADVHLGKGTLLRRAGIALPQGGTAANLARLDRLIERHRPQRLLVLGDLVHGPTGAAAGWIEQTARWRARHAAVSMGLIGGNHDRRVAVEALGFERLADQLALGPLLLCHHPQTLAGRYVLAGHVHPGVIVKDGWRPHRLPAFRFGAALGLLPAFGGLTGLQVSPPNPGERVVAVTPAGLLPLAAGR